MEINQLNDNAFVDIFSTDQAPELKGATPNFGRQEIPGVDILSKKPEEQIEPEKKEDIVETTEEEKPQEVDIIEGNNKPGRKPKYAFEDAVGYFEDRLKTGKFVKITTTNEKGEEVDFIPRTPEEFDEVLDIQINHKLENEKKTLEQSWYSSKSPAWQAVAKYSEMVDDPAELVPFIQGVQNVQSVANMNEDEIDDAEKIVRIRMTQKGDSDDIIEEQIEVLKTTDKLISTAKKYKPLIINEEKQYLSQMQRAAQLEEQQRLSMYQTIRQKSIEAIEAPIFGKQKLKNEEKAIVFDLIGEPDPESKGYKIYTAIDSLFEKGDFDTLKKVALLLANPGSFLNYASVDARNTTAESLQRKLRVSTEKGSGTVEELQDDVPRVNRTQYTSRTPKFGR